MEEKVSRLQVTEWSVTWGEQKIKDSNEIKVKSAFSRRVKN